jgi:F-type H+-transporting ATPase subunit gamma
MANLKEVRTRIASVISTSQITSAMKMVSASKLRRAQDAIIKMRPYAAKLKEILQNLSTSLEDTGESVYTKTRPVKNVLLIVIASNRGLCGAFNSNVFKAAMVLINEKYAAQQKAGNLQIMCFGKRTSEFFIKRNFKIAASNSAIFDSLKFENVAPIAEKIMKEFATGEYDVVEMVYNQFKNAAVQILSSEQFLPVIPAAALKSGHAKSAVDYIFEPSKEAIISELIPK